MSKLVETTIDAAGIKTRVLRGGAQDAPATLFLHGGLPGITPYCSGAHIWGSVPEAFGANRQVIVPDMPGSGGTMATGALTVDGLAQHVVALLSALNVARIDVVGHDLGGLVGIWLALAHPEKLRSLSVIAGPTNAPTADGLDDILFTAPPQPHWSRESQAWAFERFSYSHTHITPALLDACVAATEGAAHRAAVDMAKDYGSVLAPSMGKTRYRLWDACRNDGVRVPTQVIWSSHDPAVSREQAFVLFKTIATKQTATQMHAINRSGSLPFREQPEAFYHVVSAFQDGVFEERGA